MLPSLLVTFKLKVWAYWTYFSTFQVLVPAKGMGEEEKSTPCPLIVGGSLKKPT